MTSKGDTMNTTAQAITLDGLMDALIERGYMVTLRDLGSSGGGDWAAIEIPMPTDRFILITPAGYPWNASDGDEVADSLMAVLYADGDYDTLDDHPMLDTDVADDMPADVDAICDALAALTALNISWNGETK